MITPARIAVLLTPIVAALSGWLCQIVARYFPGAPRLDASELTAIMVAGIIVGLSAMVTWMKGYSKHEEVKARTKVDA